MTIVRDSIWSQVKPHTWKYRPRTQPITGILWHSTRGGQWYDGNTELGAFINWERSPNNKANQTLFPDYGGMASYGIGPNRIVEVMPDGYIPAWSSHPSDEHVISVEVAQSNHGQPIDRTTIQACVVFAREMAKRYGFPLTRVYPVNDWTWSGMAGHEDTVQGKAQGKSDPGAAFWEPFMAALEGDEMTKEEIEALVNQRVDAALAAQFRPLLNLAINGGPGAFTDAAGNPLPLIRDRALVNAVDLHIASHPAPSTTSRVITITGATLTGDVQE